MPFKVHVENFQSLQDVTLEVKGFTVITGTNNSGKTALMRAIRGAFQNTKGSYFVRHGKSKSVVELSFSDGAKLRWEKGVDKGDRPAYSINGGSTIYPGQAVPDEVRALGIRPVMAGGREIWPQFAPQFTGTVFLLDQPGSVLAEAVSDVNRVTQLNEALRLAESDRRTTSAELKVRLMDQKNLEVEVKTYDGFDDAVMVVEALESDLAKANKVAAALSVLSGLNDKRTKAQDSVAFLLGVEQLDLPDANSTDLLNNGLAEIVDLSKFQIRLMSAKDAVAGLAAVEAIDVPDDKTTQDIFTELLRIDSLAQLHQRFLDAQQAAADLDGVSDISIPDDRETQNSRDLLAQIQEWEGLQTRYQAAFLAVDKLTGVPVVGDIDVAGAEKSFDRIQTAENLKARWDQAQKVIQELDVENRRNTSDLTEVETEINVLLGGLGECPLCGTVTQHDHKDN